MKRALLTILFGIGFGLAFGQQEGDYQSRASGGWYTASIWEVFFNGAWRPVNTSAAGPFQNVIPTHFAGVITIKHAVVSNGNTTANQIVVDAGAVLTVQAARTLKIRTEGSNTPLQINASGRLTNLGTLDLQTQMGSVPVEVFGTLASSGVILISNPALLIFHPSSIYIHQNETGGNIPLATWDINSTCRISGLTRGNSAAPGNLGQTFGNFEFNALNAGYSPAFHLGGALKNVMGNLTVISTGSNVLRFGNGGAGLNLNIGGNLIIQGGITILAQSLSSTSNVTIGGNLVVTGGTLRIGTGNNTAVEVHLNGNFVKTGGTFQRGTGSGAGTIRFEGGVQTYTNNASIPDAVRFLVQSGSTLNLGTSFLSGTGTFTLLAGGTLNVGSLDGNGAIQAGTSGGNIRVSGTRTYQNGSTIVYNGLGTQFMASGHPANANTLLDNDDSVYLIGNVTINGTLTQNVPLILGPHTFTFGGDYVRNDQYFGILATSSLVLNGTGDLDLVLAPVGGTIYPINPINNFTLNRAGTVNVGRDLIVEGTFTLTNGTYLLGGPFAFDLTLRGNVVRTGGTIQVVNDPNLTIEGTGTLPATFPITLQNPNAYIDVLTMNRPGATFNTNAVLNLNTLNLFNGVVNNTASNFTMRTGGIIVRRSGGSVNQVLTAQTNYDVAYEVESDITTGNELPNAATTLRHLTKSGPASVLLNKDIIVNGSFTIAQGQFDVGVNNDVTIRQNFVVNGTFVPRQGLVTFAGGTPQTISGTTTIPFFNVAINQSPASTVAISTPTTIENNLGVNSGSTLNAGNNLLRILSGPVRTANVSQLAPGAVINGSVIVQRHLPKAVQRRHYFHIASPVTNATIADWDAEVAIQAAYQWSESADVYQQVGKSTTATNGKGYTVDFKTTVSSTVDVRGTLSQGNVTVPVTTSSPGDIEANDGWNLLGNPYPAAIDWDKVAVPDEIYDAVYVWDNFGNSGQGTEPGQLVSFVDGVGTPLGYDGEIAQGQAFWVKAINNGSLTFTESAKGTFTDANFYRKPEINSVLRITLHGNELKDETVVRIRDGATENFDGKYDAYKYLTEGFRISTLTADNVKAVINAFGTSSCDQVIKIAADDAKIGSYKLDFTGMDSFDASIALTLIDQVEDKTVDIRNNPYYAFSVTDENIGTMPTRFLISMSSNAPSVNTAILAAGETSCEDNSMARIMLDSSEEGVKYSVEWNGTKISEPVNGTGNSLELEVSTSTLAIGENNVRVRAQSGTCAGAVLQATPVITKVKRGEIKSVENGNICGQGSVTLRASGADSDGWYQWYESIDATEPISGQQGAEFVTPSLTKSKTYYVSVVNALGCEGQRKPVSATISYPENEVTLVSDGFTLMSSVSEGNQWYLDGNLLEEETSNTLDAKKSGLYTVTVANGGCKSSASIEMVGSEDASDLIAVFPNPTTDKVYIRVKTQNNNVIATVVNSQGIELGKTDLKGENGFKEAEFDMLPYATGVYNVKILDGHKVIIKKIAKIK